MTMDFSLFGQEHVDRYVETDGEVGFIWNGVHVLILTTTGRRSGEQRSTPLIFGRDGESYVLAASKAGRPEHPGWYFNLSEQSEVQLQVKGDRFRARARTAEGEERERLWALMNEIWPQYAEYQTKTTRQIPVVVLDRI